MRFRAALIVVCALVCSTVVRVAALCTPAEKTQIADVRNSWKTNWNAGKLDNVVNLYATDAALLPPDGSRATGKAEIKASLQKQIGSKVEINSVSLDCSGEFAYDSGTYTQDFPGGGVTMTPGTTITPGTTLGGGSKHVEGNYLVVLKHESGGSVIGGKAAIGGNAAIGGGGSRWLIVQHASTAKP